VDRSVLWRSALVQGASVALLAVVLGLALPTSFFEEWGWLAGPVVWLACALLTAGVLRLPWAQTLTGAALAGAPSVLAVAVGVHWVGPALGVVLFALWCARLARDRTLPAHTV
jgi:hypothetical protein